MRRAADAYRIITFDTVCPDEQRQVSIGRHVQTSMAIAPDGSVAGVSDVRVDDDDPAHGQVGITIVDPAHRGRRLGLALKLATHDWPGRRTPSSSPSTPPTPR